MTSPYLYAGINPEVWQTLRYGTLARGEAEPRQVARPSEVTATALNGISHVFVDGPSLRLQRVLDEMKVAGRTVPVIWIAAETEQQRAKPELVQQAAAVWDWPTAQVAWALPGEAVPATLPETPVLEVSGVGDMDEERVAYLESSAYETTGPTARLNRLTEWVTDYFGFPIAFVNLIGREMQTAKAMAGMPDGMSMDMPKEMSICQYVVAGNQPLVIPDIPQSAFFKDAGVASMVGMEAYAGIPLVNDHQLVMGSLCMVDMQPHAISLSQLEVLTALGKVVTESLDEGKSDDKRLELTGGAFNRLLQALLQDALASQRTLCVASLPRKAAGAAWAQGLDLFTVNTNWECLVCLPNTSRAEAEARLAGVLAEVGLSNRPTVIQAKSGQKWMSLLAELTALIQLRKSAELTH